LLVVVEVFRPDDDAADHAPHERLFPGLLDLVGCGTFGLLLIVALVPSDDELAVLEPTNADRIA
jgi:hypothetical protein